ncbi:hypothetical protein MRX96_010638 [Rhipicephalus microplus]
MVRTDSNLAGSWHNSAAAQCDSKLPTLLRDGWGKLREAAIFIRDHLHRKRYHGRTPGMPRKLGRKDISPYLSRIHASVSRLPKETGDRSTSGRC